MAIKIFCRQRCYRLAVIVKVMGVATAKAAACGENTGGSMSRRVMAKIAVPIAARAAEVKVPVRIAAVIAARWFDTRMMPLEVTARFPQKLGYVRGGSKAAEQEGNELAVMARSKIGMRQQEWGEIADVRKFADSADPAPQFLRFAGEIILIIAHLGARRRRAEIRGDRLNGAYQRKWRESFNERGGASIAIIDIGQRN